MSKLISQAVAIGGLFTALAVGVCSAETITAFAGTGESGFAGDGGPARFAQLNAPGSLAVDGAGGLYIMDTDNFRIRRVFADGTITTVAGTGDVSSPVEGPANQSPFIALNDIALSPNGQLHIADTDGLQKVDQAGILRYLISDQSAPNVAISNQGTVYIGDRTTVSRLEIDGSLTLLAGTDEGDSGDSGPAAWAQFWVTALATDRMGNIFVLDTYANRLRKFSPGGNISTVAGVGVADFFGDNGPANQAALNSPSSIAVDVAGNIYISDSGNQRIRKVSTDGTISTFAGQTDSSDEGDDGPAVNAYFAYPGNIAVGCSALYVVDGDRVRSIGLTSPLISQNGVTSITSSLNSVRGGELFSISGCNLARTTVKAEPGFSLPITLGGVRVTVGGMVVTLLSVSPTQIVAQLPAGVPPGTNTLSVSVSGNGSATGSINVN